MSADNKVKFYDNPPPMPLRSVCTYFRVSLLDVDGLDEDIISAKAVNHFVNVGQEDIVVVYDYYRKKMVLGVVLPANAMCSVDPATKNYIIGTVDMDFLRKMKNDEAKTELSENILKNWELIKISNGNQWISNLSAVHDLESFVDMVQKYNKIRAEEDLDMWRAAQAEKNAIAERRTSWFRMSEKKPESGDHVFVYYQHGEATSGYFQYHVDAIDNAYGRLVEAARDKIIFSAKDIKTDGSVLWWCKCPGK